MKLHDFKKCGYRFQFTHKYWRVDFLWDSSRVYQTIGHGRVDRRTQKETQKQMRVYAIEVAAAHFVKERVSGD